MIITRGKGWLQVPTGEPFLVDMPLVRDFDRSKREGKDSSYWLGNNGGID